MPAIGQGTYNGAAVGTVSNGATGTTYLAAGQFTQFFNFATRLGGTADITNFDGANYHFAVTANAPVTSPGFTGTFENTKGFLNGSFFGPNAAETGGNFSIKKPIDGFQYIASGIFTGRQ
jgi:hypothetical protein